ncbi:MAG TPA: glycosyltransferase family 1 protein [Planctomycetes bacterium]|nr:glycosyltransferase family 1 protein [Planctomycetota bacterium]HIL36421.1 glycosyltransferase family 1 protein [Planctomycetota bacterium]
MRVLVTSPVFPPDLGGPAVYVPSLARFLLDRGHDVRVVAFCSDPEPKGYPFLVQAISRGSLPVRYMRAFLAVFKAAGWADVVYVNEHLALFHVLAVKLRRKPVVIRIMVDGAWEISHRKGWCGRDNIVEFQDHSYGWQVRLVRFLQRRWWSWCTGIISCSEFLRQILLQHHGVAADKVRRIFNAYHGPKAEGVSQTRDEARAELGCEHRGKLVLTICRLMGWKRVDQLLHALVELPEDVHLAVAGDGDMQQEWEALADDLGVADRVRFLGNVPHSEIPLWIRAADVFALVSEYEGLSHTLLEVQALGTPMVASGVCGNPEVVEDGVNGLLVDPHDASDVARALGLICADPVLGASFVAEGLKKAKAFTRDGTFEQVEAVLEAATRGYGPGGQN